MKKRYIIAILIIVLISFFTGYGLCFYKFNKKINNIEKEKQILVNSSVDLRKEFEREKRYYIEEKYKHPIDKKEAYCSNKAKNSPDIRECVYDASDEWEKEINKYMRLLKKSTTPEQYKIINESQNLWIKQTKKDHQIVDVLIWNHGGTMYFDIGAVEDKDLVKNRAEFLRTVYSIHTTDKY